MKILHTADWHVREKDIEECEKCLSFLVETAEKEAVDVIVIAGDIFDSQEVKLDSKAAKLSVKTISALADIAPVAIVLGTPSHDGKAPEVLRFARGKYDVFVASHPQQVYLEDGFLFDRPAGDREPEAVLSFIPQPTKQYFQTAAWITVADQEIGQAMSGLFAGFGAQAAQYKAPHILVGHFNVSGAQLSTGQVMTGRDIEVNLDQMMLARPDLICLGHIHKPQQLGGRAFYSGSIYAENWGENHEHGFYIHEVDPQSTVSPGLSHHRFISTPHKRLVRVVAGLTPVLTETEKTDLYYHNHDDNIEGATVRIDLTVWQDEAGEIDKGLIEEHYKSLGAESVDIRLIRVPREVVRAASVLKAHDLPDKIKAMAELRGEAISDGVLAKAVMLASVQSDILLQEVAR